VRWVLGIDGRDCAQAARMARNCPAGCGVRRVSGDTAGVLDECEAVARRASCLTCRGSGPVYGDRDTAQHARCAEGASHGLGVRMKAPGAWRLVVGRPGDGLGARRCRTRTAECAARCPAFIARRSGLASSGRRAIRRSARVPALGLRVRSARRFALRVGPMGFGIGCVECRAAALERRARCKPRRSCCPGKPANCPPCPMPAIGQKRSFHLGDWETQGNLALVTNEAFVRGVVRSARRSEITDRPQERACNVTQGGRHAGEQLNYHVDLRPAFGRLTRPTAQCDCLGVKSG